MNKIQIIFITLLIAGSVSATNYYVKSSSGDYKGTSWALANNNLQKMVNGATAGDTIFVATGVYSGGFIVREGITVMGGYTANTKSPRERILITNAVGESEMSILDGGGTQRTLTQLMDFTKKTLWDGFMIRNGTATEAISAGYLVYSGKDIVGIVYLYNPATETGKMISMTNTKKAWGGYHVDFTESELPYLGVPINDMNGAENTAAIVNKIGETNPDFKDNYKPNNNYAAYWCNNFSAGNFSWHLPSVGEWQEIFAQKSQINDIMVAANVSLANGCWTSSHAGELSAWAFYFENALKLPVLKFAEKNVRAICSFHKDDLTSIPVEPGSVFLLDNGRLNNCIVDDKLIVCEDCTINNLYNLAEDFNFQIFPNPVKQNENFTVISDKTGNLQLIDISGKVIFSKKITGNNTITAPENSGVYVLKFNNLSTKLIVY